MKNLLIATFILCASFIYAQDITGKWITVDDVTGLDRSVVEIYKENNQFYGKILKGLNKKDKTARLCTECPGDKKNKPMVGLVFIEALSQDGTTYEGGTILDPENGKTYKCKISLLDNGKLEVRGFIGFSLLGRSQYWRRAI